MQRGTQLLVFVMATLTLANIMITALSVYYFVITLHTYEYVNRPRAVVVQEATSTPDTRFLEEEDYTIPLVPNPGLIDPAMAP